jgi:hypothetical protein
MYDQAAGKEAMFPGLDWNGKAFTENFPVLNFRPNTRQTPYTVL